MGQHKTKPREITSKPKVKLSNEELTEFRLRHSALTACAHQHIMVQESYQAWVKGIGEKHQISGEFGIDMTTGAITNG